MGVVAATSPMQQIFTTRIFGLLADDSAAARPPGSPRAGSAAASSGAAGIASASHAGGGGGPRIRPEAFVVREVPRRGALCALGLGPREPPGSQAFPPARRVEDLAHRPRQVHGITAA